jgi:hypothetical protein
MQGRPQVNKAPANQTSRIGYIKLRMSLREICFIETVAPQLPAARLLLGDKFIR